MVEIYVSVSENQGLNLYDALMVIVLTVASQNSERVWVRDVEAHPSLFLKAFEHCEALKGKPKILLIDVSEKILSHLFYMIR